MKIGTKAIHAGVLPDPSTGAIMTPIYQTSTYVQSAPGEHQGFEYSRTHNPTRTALQANIAALESAEYGLVYGSGLAAIDAIMKTLKPGDEVVSTNDLYGGTYRIFTGIFQKFGIKFHFVPMNDMDAVEAVINENTKLIWVETPTNPMMQVLDIAALVAVAKKYPGVKVGVDNTFATPYLQRPLELGADLVMHSVTKYLGGHSDVVMGALATNDTEWAEALAYVQNASGAVAGPQDCFLVLRGLKTLHVRMQRHCENGAAVARHLAQHPKVDKVFWPGFEDHPGYAIASKQMKDFGGMLSFSLKGDRQEDAFRVLSNLKIFSLAESLGGVESLAGHPASMTHASIPSEKRAQIGLTDSLIRLSVGIEDIEDLLADLDQAIG